MKIATLLQQMKMPTMILPVGLPASGKSTFLKDLETVVGNDRVMTVSFDNVLNALADHMNISYGQAMHLQKTDKDVKRAVQKAYDDHVERTKTFEGIVYIDQTNVYKSARDRRLADYPDHQKIGIFFDVPETECKRRCRQRFAETGKDVPVEAVEKMARELRKDRPDPNDFDLLFRVDKDGNLSLIPKTSQPSQAPRQPSSAQNRR